MADLIWAKFYWSDWLSDMGLRRCSLEARGLWMDMLCIAAQHNPIGYVAVNDDPLSIDDLARLSGSTPERVTLLLSELLKNDVFSTDRKGRIYNRRMIKDEKKRKTAQKNGKTGGNPSLSNKRIIPPSDNLEDKPEVKGGLNTQRLETRDQRLESKKEDDKNHLLSDQQIDEPKLAIERYNALAKEIGAVVNQQLTPARRSAVKSRLKDCGGLDGWDLALAKARASPFLRGEVNTFRLSLKFLCQQESFASLMEGKYDDRKQKNKPNSVADGFEKVRAVIAERELRELEESGIFDEEADLGLPRLQQGPD